MELNCIIFLLDNTTSYVYYKFGRFFEKLDHRIHFLDFIFLVLHVKLSVQPPASARRSAAATGAGYTYCQ